METVDTDKIDFAAMGVPENKVAEAKAAVEKFAAENQTELEAHVSPAGTLNVCPLLDQKRLAWLIPDAAIEAGRSCLFDHILIRQIPMLSQTRGDKFDTHFGGGLIAKSEKSKEAEERAAPRGVIVGAGLTALDALRSHGVDLGHTVKFLKNMVHRVQCDMVASKWEWLSVCHVHDILHSEELAAALKAGHARIARGDDGAHRYEDVDGRQWSPVVPEDDGSM